MPSADSAIRSCGELALRCLRSRDPARRSGATGGRTRILAVSTRNRSIQNVTGSAEVLESGEVTWGHKD